MKQNPNLSAVVIFFYLTVFLHDIIFAMRYNFRRIIGKTTRVTSRRVIRVILYIPT
jgi:hypothetical protein